jgi:hypothetical protein
MHERQMPPSSPPGDVPEAVRVQILATEHWSLLAARNITFGAVFSRTSIFLTVVSAAVVALALVAQATEFSDDFQVFALLVLPVALFIGVATHIRILDARLEDLWLVSGMNRLRHAYLEIAPELEPYFVTGHHDDRRGVYETYGPGTELRVYRVLASTSMLVGVVDAALAGAVGGLIARSLGAGSQVSLLIGAALTVVIVVVLAYVSIRIVERGRRLLEPRFGR